jgi:hypothetical protein
MADKRPDQPPEDRASMLRRAARHPAPADELPLDDAPDPWDEEAALADTVGDELVEDRRTEHEAPPPASDPTYDDLLGHEVVDLDRLDPEAGTMSVARLVRRQVKRATKTPGGQLVLSVPIGLVGIALAILAIVHQTTPLIVAAAIVAPPSLIAWIVLYRRWLGQKRYAYRLLESLGEDVSDFTPDQMYRVLKTRRRSRRRRR